METYPKLMRLTRLGDSRVDQDFLDGLRSDPITDPDAVEEISATYSLEAFDAAVTSCITKHTTKPEAGDAELAEAVHQALGIPRRIAMDMGVWRFLACIARPDYVRYRWG